MTTVRFLIRAQGCCPIRSFRPWTLHRRRSFATVSYTHLDMSEDEMLRLLATDGMLVKRPLLVGDDFVLVGFKESVWAERLKIG